MTIYRLLLPECKPDEVRHVLARLSGIKIDVGGEMLPLAFSAGCANFVPGEAPEEHMKRADEALYINKRAGKEETELGVSRCRSRSIVVKPQGLKAPSWDGNFCRT